MDVADPLGPSTQSWYTLALASAGRPLLVKTNWCSLTATTIDATPPSDVGSLTSLAPGADSTAAIARCCAVSVAS